MELCAMLDWCDIYLTRRTLPQDLSILFIPQDRPYIGRLRRTFKHFGNRKEILLGEALEERTHRSLFQRSQQYAGNLHKCEERLTRTGD